MRSIKEKLEKIRERIVQAAEKSGRDPREIKILGAAKGQPVDKIREAASAGLRLIGENYVQEAEIKKRELQDLPLSWHLIGHLQKNKAKKAFLLFEVIETVDRVEIAERLSRLAQEAGRDLSVFIQVNIGAEPQKKGVLPQDLPFLVAKIRDLPGLKITGLMCIPPYFEDPEAVRPYFRRLREYRDLLREKFDLPELTELSMGMSHDFEVAVEEGATIVRIGTALFGERPRKAGSN